MNEDKWLVRYWRRGDIAKYVTGLPYDIAVVHYKQYRKQGYDTVCLMRDKR